MAENNCKNCVITHSEHFDGTCGDFGEISPEFTCKDFKEFKPKEKK